MLDYIQNVNFLPLVFDFSEDRKASVTEAGNISDISAIATFADGQIPVLPVPHAEWT